MSLLVYQNNYRGIQSQYNGFNHLLSHLDEEAQLEAVEALDEAITYLQGFRGDPNGAENWQHYNKLSIFNRKKIYDNAVRVIHALMAAKKALGISDPEGGDDEEGGEEVATPGFESQTEEAVKALQELGNIMTNSVGAMKDAIESGDLQKAREMYEEARHEYEQIEVAAGCFEDEDTDIDARPYSFELGEEDAAFKGFHKIERALFRDNNMALAKAYAEEMVASTAELNEELNNMDNFNVNKLFDGMIGLATEVPAKKIASEEESFSGLSLLIFTKNLAGIKAVYSPFREALSGLNSDLVDEIDKLFADGESLFEKIATNSDYKPAFSNSKTMAYHQLSTDAELKEIVNVFYSLSSKLSSAAEAMGLTGSSLRSPRSFRFHKKRAFNYKKLG